MKYITIKDIAKELVVSVSTVSRALNNDQNIRKETRDKIMETARRMGYRRNPVAMNLKNGNTKTIGVLVPEMTTPYAARVIEGIQNVCHAHNYKVLITSASEDWEKERTNLEIMKQFMIDGIIACPCDHHRNTDMFQHILDSGVPLVFYDRIPYGIKAPEVVIDDETKAFFLVEHLIRAGRKHIAYIGANSNVVYNSVLRHNGYMEALKRYRIKYNAKIDIEADGLSYFSGAAAVDRILQENIDAIFAFTDTLAIGAMNRLKSLGRKIPKDVAIAGFSGTELSTIVSPQLTTVEPPQFEMGQEAAKLIIKHINNDSSNIEKIILDANIIYRDSTENY
jgi:LacI family transcriptional regulator